MGLKFTAPHAILMEPARRPRILNFKSHMKHRAGEKAFVVAVALELVKSAKLIINIEILIYGHFIELHFPPPSLLPPTPGPPKLDMVICLALVREM